MLNTIKKSPKILVRSPNWVGDAVMATPVPHALKGTAPGCRIHILAKAWAAPVWERHPDVDRVIVLDGRRGLFRLFRWIRLVRDLRRERYDLGLLLPMSFSSAWMMWWAGVRRRVGYAADGRRWLLKKALPWRGGAKTLPRPKQYLNVARLAGADVDLCQEWVFTVKVAPEELARADELLGPKPAKGLRVGLAPGSVAPSRRWPVERFAQLADRLAAQGHQVVVVGSQGDAHAAKELARRAKKKILVLAGNTTLREGIAVIRRLDLLISNDSGSMHLAYAQGVPVLVLQGAADPRVTGPFGSKSEILRDESLECAPCVRNECSHATERQCMLNLSLDRVWDKVQVILASRLEKAAKNVPKSAN